MIGAIADDFTGATDIAVAFRRAGLRVTIRFNEPNTASELPETRAEHSPDVLIVALKSRTLPAEEAVRQSLHALAWLRERGARQFFFKYCSTFDSRAEGNIGPVTDALRDELDAERTVFVPASPAHLRTQYKGYLFAGQQLLSESPMRDHPLTPMTDAYIPRVLAAQTTHPVGLVPHEVVVEGSESILHRFAEETSPYLVIDAISETDLAEIGEAVAEDVLVTGAAGLAHALGRAAAKRLGRSSSREPDARQREPLPAAVLAGSCSARTLEQIAVFQRSQPSLLLDAVKQPDPNLLAEAALAWYDEQEPGRAPLVYSSRPPAELRRAQELLGADRVSEILEKATGLIARGLLTRGVRRLIVAGGETSGAVVTALDIEEASIGEEAAPGVPWIRAEGARPVSLLLKSGNFGDPELLVKAVEA